MSFWRRETEEPWRLCGRNVRKRDHTLHQEPCRRLIVSTTFGPMRRHRARGQLWAFVYLAVGHLLGVVKCELSFVSFTRLENETELDLSSSRWNMRVEWLERID